MKTIVHVTHEAVQKIGGIGTVLHGLCTAKTYLANTDRTILVCPLFWRDGAAADRLGPDGQVLYSSLDGMTDHPLAGAFQEIQTRFSVDLVYGRRRFTEPDNGVQCEPEVVLIDVRSINEQETNDFKARLWERFGIESTAYEDAWEFEQYMRLAPPTLAVLRALGACSSGHCVILAHEFMGMPTALAAMMDPWEGFRTVFYAHEVAPMRKIVEDHPGHDTMFYNAMAEAMRQGRTVDDVFGDQRHYFKHSLVEASRHCDAILAVGDYVVKELRFLTPDLGGADINLTYNGIPASAASVEDKLISKARMQQYAENLLGWRPDDIFTHVSRMSTSKALWRDVRVLEYLEPMYRQNNRTAVLFVLSTERPRNPHDVRHMERWWKWPVAHREVWPDLGGAEAVFHAVVQGFNARARNICVVFVNQFGWSRELCGDRMPADMSLLDIRRGSDVEFGQSIYEPFGIAQLEPLTFGAVCVVTNVCGCAGFVEKVTEGRGSPNVIVADYFGGLPHAGDAARCVAEIDRDVRNAVEQKVAKDVAGQLWQHLPKNAAELAERMRCGYELAGRMSWEVVAGQYVLPAIEKAIARQPAGQPV